MKFEPDSRRPLMLSWKCESIQRAERRWSRPLRGGRASTSCIGPLFTPSHALPCLMGILTPRSKWWDINFHYPLRHRQYLFFVFYSFHVASGTPICPWASEKCIIKARRSARTLFHFVWSRERLWFLTRPSVLQRKLARLRQAGSAVC